MSFKIKLLDLFQNLFSKNKPVKKAGQINPTVPLEEVQGKINLPKTEILNCDQVFALLDKYVELDMEGEDARQKMPGVHLHLKTCQECSEEYKTLLSVYKKLKQYN